MNAAEVKELEEIVRSLREGAKHGGSSVEWGLVQGAHAIEAFLARHSGGEAAESEKAEEETSYSDGPERMERWLRENGVTNSHPAERRGRLESKP